MNTLPDTNAHLSMTDIRWLVNELNTDRARLARALALMDETLGDEAATTRAQLESQHDAVLAALERVARGSYGLCERCGEAIPYGRLIVMPEVRHCVGCHR